MEPTPDHLVITPPSRYYGEGAKILWIDWHWHMIEQCLEAMRGSPVKTVTHLFGGNDTDFRWLLDVANQADLIVVNLGQTSQADPFKGSFLPLDKTYYFGRKDLAEIYYGYVDDPLGLMLEYISNKIADKQRGTNESGS